MSKDSEGEEGVIPEDIPGVGAIFPAEGQCRGAKVDVCLAGSRTANAGVWSKVNEKGSCRR